MDTFADIGKYVVGGFLLLIGYRLLGAILIQLPGHFVYSLFVAREKDPDNLIDIDPSGRISTIVGLVVWAIVITIAYAVYTVTK